MLNQIANINFNKLRSIAKRTFIQQKDHFFVYDIYVSKRYMYPKCIIAIFDCVYKFLCNFIHLKPRSAHPKNSGKSVTTALLVEQIDRNQFRLGYY